MTESDAERLRRLCLKKLPDRYGRACFPQAIRRLNHELAILDSVGRPEEFLAVEELVEFARQEGIHLRLLTLSKSM